MNDRRPAALREVIRDLGPQPKKRLGRELPADSTDRRIARAAGPLEQVTVVEIGPGPGGLTRALLLEGAARVVAIEKDQRCLPALADIAALYPGRLDIVAADAREVDYSALALSSPARIAANLPYSVSTPLLVSWLKTAPWPPWFDRLVLMFQREVAERIVAAPGGKDYGRLAVLSQWRTMPRILFTIPAAAFTPRPKVDSALVELVPRPAPTPCDVLALDRRRYPAAAFGQSARCFARAPPPDRARQRGAVGIRSASTPNRGPRGWLSAEFCRIAMRSRRTMPAGAKARPANSATKSLRPVSRERRRRSAARVARTAATDCSMS